MNAAGVAQVTWAQADGIAQSIWSRRYVPAEGWGQPVRIEDRPEVASQPNVAVDPAGNAVAVFLQQLQGRPLVHANTYR
jgi:hypothetical protein